MRIRRGFAIALAAPLLAGAAVGIPQVDGTAASADLEGFGKVNSRYLDEVYLRLGADLRGYTRVIVDATQVTFAKRWQSDLNEHRIAVLQGTTTAQAEQIAQAVRSSLKNRFANGFRHAGYEVVAAPGRDVLAVSLRLTDLHISAPSTVTNALPSRVYTGNAGEATLILELRDAATGTLLGRIVDRRATASRGTSLGSSVRTAGPTTSATNQFDFESMFDLWAHYSIDEIRARSPLAISAPAQNP